MNTEILYVIRNDLGEIIGVNAIPPEQGEYEALPANHPDIHKFFNALVEKKKVREQLTLSDREFMRVLEDLIYLLVNKEVIKFTDLPDAAQRKLSARGDLRKKLNALEDFICETKDERLI